MTRFEDLFGPKMGHQIEQYWPYGFLVFSAYLMLMQIGIWKIIYTAIKQLIVMGTMLFCCTIWYVLISQHIATLMQHGTTSVIAGFTNLFTNTDQNNSKILDPITEILII
eukprot:860228_1